LLRIGRLTTRFSYFDNKKVSKMEARASREALRSRYKIFISMRSRSSYKDSVLLEEQVQDP
jgi:hypothetical protein